MKEDIETKYIKKQRMQRRKFLLKIGIPYCLIAIVVFLFGYDKPLFDTSKLYEFLPPFFTIWIIIIIISYKKYRTKNICKNCGAIINNIESDCIIGKKELIGTKTKTEYKRTKATVKGKTTFLRGGYSMRNSIMEPTSESTYEIEQKIPIEKTIYIYKYEYRCKKCNALVCTRTNEK